MCFRFNLSFHDVEDLMAERGIDVSYETIRRWVDKFGRIYVPISHAIFILDQGSLPRHAKASSLKNKKSPNHARSAPKARC